MNVRGCVSLEFYVGNATAGSFTDTPAPRPPVSYRYAGCFSSTIGCALHQAHTYENMGTCVHVCVFFLDAKHLRGITTFQRS